MPSDTAIVLNSIGNPPAERTPSLARLASRSSGMLQGVTSFQDDTTATCGLSQSSSVMPDRPQHGAGRGPVGEIGDIVGTQLQVLFTGGGHLS